jgi:hypothetical protein
MDKPDLREMAAEASELYRALDAFASKVEEASFAARGEWDEEKDALVPDTGNGDSWGLLDEAHGTVTDAMKSIASTRRMLATQHGLREFSDTAVWQA